MFAISGHIDVKGDPTGRAFVRTIEHRGQALARLPLPIVTAFARAIKDDIADQFRSGGRPPWRPAMPNTLAGARIRGKRHQLLGGPGGAIFARGTGVRVVVLQQTGTAAGALDIYARFPGKLHQEGRRGPWTITARSAPFLRFPVATSARSSVKTHRTRITVGWVRARSVRHPGYVARPFVRITPDLVDRGLIAPLRAHLARPGG